MAGNAPDSGFFWNCVEGVDVVAASVVGAGEFSFLCDGVGLMRGKWWGWRS